MTCDFIRLKKIVYLRSPQYDLTERKKKSNVGDRCVILCRTEKKIIVILHNNLSITALKNHFLFSIWPGSDVILHLE